MNPALAAALIAAFGGLVVSIIGLIPNLGRLRRLERVVMILEKIEDEHARKPLIDLRDRLIGSLEVRPFNHLRFWTTGIVVSGAGVVGSLGFLTFAPVLDSVGTAIAAVSMGAYISGFVGWIIWSIVRAVRTR